MPIEHSHWKCMREGLYIIPNRGNIMEFILKMIAGLLIGGLLLTDEDIQMLKDILNGKWII